MIIYLCLKTKKYLESETISITSEAVREQGISKNRTNYDLDEMVACVCTAAKTGQTKCYEEASKLPYTRKPDKESNWGLKNDSLRYAAISQVGISRWLRYHAHDREMLPDLWPRILQRLERITRIGDLALSLWAGIESGEDNCDQFAQTLKRCWDEQADSCNAVELGWIVQACTIAIRQSGFFESHLRPVLDDAHKRLSRLFDVEHNLFQRHNRTGTHEIISRRVACFADQVYPILAMSTFGTTFDDKTSIDFAGRAVEQICRFQGDLGQWQWHYDVLGGKVCEEYPVFSVHQDAMAPVAIIAADKACGVDHTKEIELGMRWLFGANELEVDMVLQDKGIIWRDIERREPNQFSRVARSLCCITGMDKLHKLAGGCFDKFVINHECRPYHLGWILYAWAEYGL